MKGRGGIHKKGRQGQPTHTTTDRDGDVRMGAAPSLRGGRGGIRKTNNRQSTASSGEVTMRNSTVTTKSKPKPALNTAAIEKHLHRAKAEEKDIRTKTIINEAATGHAHPSSRTSLDEILVHGLQNSKAATKPDGGLKQLLEFLQKKASGTHAKPNELLRIKKSRIEGEAVIISVRPQDTPRFLHLDGFSFAGTEIKVEIDRPANGTTSKEGQELKIKFKAMLERRYNPETKLLDLSSLGTDPEFANTGMFEDHSRESKFFLALMTVCDEAFKDAEQKKQMVHSVSLARNALPNLGAVTVLAQTFPDLKNLDLSDNSFQKLGALDAWRRKFRSLDQLYVNNNPFTTEVGWQDELRNWYPTLTVLNGTQVRSAEEAAINAAAKKAQNFAIKPALFNDSTGTGAKFLKNFFTAFDSDRQGLLNAYYDGNTTFSINVNTSAPTITKASPWGVWIKKSRNLNKVTTPTGRQNRLYKGVDKIRAEYADLPETRHPNFEADGDKWLLESHLIPGVPSPESPHGVNGLVIITHGEFAEPDADNNPINRSFDRTFIIAPGGGHDGLRIVSDMLTLRSYAGFEAFKPQAEDVQKMVLIQECAKATGMTLEYAKMCMEGAGFDPAKALASFQQLKATLPADAFTH